MSVDKKMRIVFVDDESRVLDGIRRMLRPMLSEWEMAFASSGQEVLDLMAEQPFDVIVSDIRMPGMSGTQLLERIREEYPATIRIVLSGQAGKHDVFKSVGPIHQYLPKPCDAETLKSTVIRACSLRNLLGNDKLKKAASEMESLPSLPEHYSSLLKELESPEASVKRVEEIISRDMGMSAKLLQLVNSAFFGVRRQVSNPARAVMLLGLDAVRNLVLLTHVFSQFKGINVVGFDTGNLWDHSLVVAGLAKGIASAEKMGGNGLEEAFIGGLLHDVGKLVLASELPADYSRVLGLTAGSENGMLDAEREVFGATHADIGAYLLGLWGLADSTVEAVAFHHCPSEGLGSGFIPLTAVHVANAISKSEPGTDESEVFSEIEIEYLAGLGVEDRLPVWHEMYLGGLEKEGNQ